MWVRARNTFKLINNYINSCYNEQSNSTSLEQLMTMLNKTRTLLINVFRNPTKNSLHRSVLNKNGEIVELDSGEVVKIDDGLRNEAIIISDLFNCDEFDALELVITGEVQIRHFPFLTRGLCAVICYYDAHRFISAAVKALAEFRIDEKVLKPRELSEYLNQLLSDTAFIRRLIELLQTVNVQSELQSLHHPHVNGLGGPKHQEILRELIEETLENYAQTFHLICSSWKLESAPPFLDDLFAPLKQLQPNTLFKNTHLSLWTAALILISPHNLYNMRCARDLLMEFHKKVILEEWQDSCMQASLQFAVVVSYNWLSVHQLVQEVLGGFAIKEDDLFEKAVDGLAFHFIRKCVIAMPKFKESFIAFATVDTLLKNFIAHLSNQVVLLQHSGEMELQYVEEMLERGQLHRPQLHFENFIRCIADLYDGDSKYLEQLSAQFCSSESEGLVNFLRNCRQLISPVLQVAFLDMLKNICKCQKSAYFIFGLLSSTKLVESTLCWDHFWTAMHDYLGLFKHKKIQTSSIIHTPSEQHDTFQQIPHAELAGLVAWVQLVEIIAKNDETARRQFTDNNSWSCVETAVSLVTSAIPLVLKGALFRFLASIAIDEHGALKIWATLISLSVLTKTSSGKLVGIQDELETRECAFKCYDSSIGFLHLIKTLFLHTKNIDKRYLLQYLHFIVASIICKFADRSYENIRQMWHLCSEACDALYNFLHRYVITAESVMNMEPQIVILSQILNDSPVFRSLGAVLRDGAERLQDFCPRSTDHEAATLSVLRFLDICVSLHAPLIDAVRTTNSSIIIASLDSLFLSSLESNGTAPYITVIASYLTQSELISKHVYHVISILRELCCCQPSIQCRLVQALSPLALELIESFARLTSVKMTVIEVSVLDSPIYHGIDELSMARIRGETVRLFIDMCSASIENDGTTNLAYLFCGFRMPNSVNFVIEPPGLNGSAMTCLHSLVDLLLEMTTSEAPFALPFGALFEPTLRLILRLISINSDCSAVILRFFRSNHDLIYRLASSSLLLDTKANSEEEEDLVLKNLKITIQGLVLHLSAIELSSLLQNRHYSQSERYFHLMLSQRDEIMEEQNSRAESVLGQIGFSYIPNKQKNEREWPFLWKLLRIKTNFNEMELPAMELLDTKKLQHILPLCLRPTSANVQQCDIEHLNWLLYKEFNTVISEMQPKFSLGVSQDAKQLLQYCATYNFMKNVEASLRQLLSGWLSFVNVLAILSPVPFLAFDVQYQYLSDALYLLLNYASDIYMDAKLSSTVSHCLLRLTASICALLNNLKEETAAFRFAITDVADVLIRFLIRPGKHSLQTKLDLYACISLILNYSTETLLSENAEHQENVSHSGDDFLFSLTAFNLAQHDLLRAVFTKYGHELISLLSKDICDSPPGLRFVSLFCLTQILREDALGSQSLAFEFLRTGMLRYILESVANINLSGCETNDIRSLEHCNVVLTLFIRLGLTNCGWNGLYNVNALQILTNIPLWSNPPKYIFLASNFDLRIRSVPSMYMNYVANIIYLSIALCSNSHWKRISIQILGLLSCSADVLNHLMRTNRQYSFLMKCGMLVAHIHYFDVSAQSFIEKSSCLNALRKLFGKISLSSSTPLKTSFSTPRYLFNNSSSIIN